MKVILFDGVCNLCNSSVNWVIDHDRKNQFKFAALQSDYGKNRLNTLKLSPDIMDTVILDAGGAIFTESDAILRIVKDIGGIYSLAGIFLFIPKFIRDFFYKVVSRNRYRWFGKRELCRVPTPDLQSKFLE